MVRRFLKNGSRVTVWNRSAEKARALEQDGATAAASAVDAVKGMDRIHIVLSDDRVVDGVLEQIVPSVKPGAIVIDHSTTLPEETKRRAERMRAKAVRFLHAPVFMSPQMAADGVGLMLVSGPQKELDAVKPELDSMTGEVWYLGERADLAANYKLYGNCMLFAISGGLADVIAMARANGVDAIEAMSIFTKFQAGNIINARGPRMARGETTPPMFTIEMARKDVRLMTDAAKGQPLVVLPCIAKRMDDLIASGVGGSDITAIAPSRA
jgi:3-hydroxyisobutyrate dehydrogenase-like beta-hydroxyacid dehydrogenase